MGAVVDGVAERVSAANPWSYDFRSEGERQYTKS